MRRLPPSGMPSAGWWAGASGVGVGAAAGLGWETALENLHYLGAAVFFYCAGRGPYSMDRMLFPALDSSPALARHALPALRISIGVGFAFVAFTEKLANPALARLFLEQHPLNFTAAVGLPTLRLVRVHVGDIGLEALAPGEWRPLAPA